MSRSFATGCDRAPMPDLEDWSLIGGMEGSGRAGNEVIERALKNEIPTLERTGAPRVISRLGGRHHA